MRKASFLYYFRAALKRLAFNSSAIICYVMKSKKVFHPTPENTVKSYLCLSNEWLHKHRVIIYHCFNYKFANNPIEISVLTSSKLINEILTVWASARGKYKAVGHCNCHACLSFLINLMFFVVFTEGRVGVTEL